MLEKEKCLAFKKNKPQAEQKTVETHLSIAL